MTDSVPSSTPHDAGNCDASAPSNHHGDTVLDQDARIVAAVRSGEHDAFADLVDRHGDRLYASLYHLANRDPDVAAELTQEAFIRAFERLDRFAGHSTFFTWLYRLARNRALDLLTRRRPQALDDSILANTAVDERRPDAGLEQHETTAQVQAALARLEPWQREIILLRDFDDLGYPAIAAALEIAEGTVKSRLNRARQALRQALEQDGGCP